MFKDLMKNFLLMVTVTFLIIACNSEHNKISLVKDGILGLNRSITIGDALDNWHNCESVSWDSFETDNKMKVVEYKCIEAGLQDYYKIVEQEASDSYSNFFSQDPILSSVITLQFIINHDNSFYISYVDRTYHESSLCKCINLLRR